VRASSPEAQADAYTMLALIAEREEGPAAAVEHFLTVTRLAPSLHQKADAHENLAKLHAQLADEEKEAEHEGLSRTLREQAAAEDAEAARKKAEEEAKSAKSAEPLPPMLQDEDEDDAEGYANADADAEEDAARG